MIRADSTEPPRFAPEMYRTVLHGATGIITFDQKGDRRDAEMTIFRMQGGKIVPVMVYRGGTLSAFGSEAAPAQPDAPVPATPPPANRPPGF